MSKEMLSTSKEIPKHKNALEEKYKTATKLTEEKEPLNPETIEKQKTQLPEPSGWRLLVTFHTERENQRWYNYSTRIIRKITYSHELWLCNQSRTVGLP